MDVAAGQAPAAAPARTNTVYLDGPATLSQPDTRYVVTADVVADTTGFSITASHVTLDFDGHSLIYGTQAATSDPTHKGGASFGVTAGAWNLQDIAVVNGSIVQGAGACKGVPGGFGCNPINAVKTVKSPFVIAGMYLESYADDASVIYAPWLASGSEIHHNTVYDKGKVVTNRHQGVPAIAAADGSDYAIHHNLIRQCRHVGIGAGNGSDVHHNEIHIVSVDSNSYGVFAYEKDGSSIHSNKILGVGVHPVGIGVVSLGSQNNRIYSNYTETENTVAGAEYGSTGSAGFRVTWGSRANEVYCNFFHVRAGHRTETIPDGSWGRAVWLGYGEEPDRAAASLSVHHNIMLANSEDKACYAAGLAINGPAPNLEVVSNRIISSHTNVAIEDDYGSSMDTYPRLVANTLVKAGALDTYRTLADRLYGYKPSSVVLVDTTFEGGASLTAENVDLQHCMATRRGNTVEAVVGHTEGAQELIDYSLTNDPDTVSAGSASEPYGECGFKVTP